MTGYLQIQKEALCIRGDSCFLWSVQTPILHKVRVISR